ncbi:MAG: signal peptidase I [Otoolea sp.]
MSKVVTRICNFISVIMVLIVIAVGAVMIVPKVMGNDIYAVMSGSMEPFYHVGSVVIVNTHVNPEEIQVGDPITFRMESNAVATHRVIASDLELRQFRTKGDANEDEDASPVSYDNLIGKAGVSVPYIGYIPLYMKTPKGMFCIGAYVIIFILLQLIPEIVKPEKEEEQSDGKH